MSPDKLENWKADLERQLAAAIKDQVYYFKAFGVAQSVCIKKEKEIVLAKAEIARLTKLFGEGCNVCGHLNTPEDTTLNTPEDTPRFGVPILFEDCLMMTNSPWLFDIFDDGGAIKEDDDYDDPGDHDPADDYGNDEDYKDE